MTNASVVVLTARTKALTLTTLSGNFTTTSNGTYVDVTGASVSVPSTFFVCCRYDIQKSTSGTCSARFVHGAGPTVDQTGGTVGVARLTKMFQVFNNATGGAVTYKVQAQSTADTNVTTIFQSGTNVANNAQFALVNAPFGIQDNYAAGQVLIQSKAIVTSLDIFNLGSVGVNMLGGSDPAFTTGIVSFDGLSNNVLNGITYGGPSSTYAEGGASVASSGFLLMFDYSGTDVSIA